MICREGGLDLLMVVRAAMKSRFASTSEKDDARRAAYIGSNGAFFVSIDRAPNAVSVRLRSSLGCGTISSRFMRVDEVI